MTYMFRRIVNSGGGDCFFIAVEQATQVPRRWLREACVDFVKEFQFDIRKTVTPSTRITLDEWRTLMKQPSSWANVELIVACEHILECEVSIVGHDKQHPQRLKIYKKEFDGDPGHPVRFHLFIFRQHEHFELLELEESSTRWFYPKEYAFLKQQLEKGNVTSN